MICNLMDSRVFYDTGSLPPGGNNQAGKKGGVPYVLCQMRCRDGSCGKILSQMWCACRETCGAWAGKGSTCQTGSRKK